VRARYGSRFEDLRKINEGTLKGAGRRLWPRYSYIGGPLRNCCPHIELNNPPGLSRASSCPPALVSA
jgi:hypothetical protein